MSDGSQGSPWLIAGGLRPVRQCEELSLAAQLDAARVALLFAEDALANGLVIVGTKKRKWKASVRDEIVLAAVRNALRLIGGRS